MNIYYVDGKFVPADQAVIPVDDLAIIRGIGVFDLMRTYQGHAYFLEEHVSRLVESARQIGLALPWSHAEICAVARQTLSRNNLEEANIRIIVTGGPSQDFMTPTGNPRLLVLVTPLPELPARWYSHGVKVITQRVKRDHPGTKSINYLPATMALRDAKARDAVEVLFLDDDDNVLEGATSNLFAIVDGRLITPGRGILFGITRKVVLDTAGRHYPVEVRDLPKSELLGAQEVFITGTNKGLVPVVQIDDVRIGNGRPGPETGRIAALVQAHLAGRRNKIGKNSK